MNPYKLRVIVNLLKERWGGLSDVTGEKVTAAELVACFGLDEMLTAPERRWVLRELDNIADAESFLDSSGLRAK